MIEPLLEGLEPRVTVEVGSDQGFNTKNLAEFAQRTGGVLHVVDPLPKYDVQEWKKRYEPHIVFHRAPSLEALSSIGSIDVVLIDGDHNWYTVFHELKLLEHKEGSGSSFPFVMLHDVRWPYGRRDLYYEPDRIPPEQMQPHGQGGLRPGQRGLDPDGGLNTHRLNAEKEGGPRNGVLTAVEDFMGQSPLDLRLVVIPGINGLGLLYPSDVEEQKPTATKFINGLRSSDTLVHLIETVEEARLEAQIESIDRRAELKVLRRQLVDLERTIGAARREAAAAGERLDRAIGARDTVKAQLEHVRRSLREVRSKEKIARRKTTAARAQVRRLKTRVALLERELSEARSEGVGTRQAYDNLRSRKSVRLALRGASFVAPLVRIRRGRRSHDLPNPGDS
jgi:hypothetical protein